MSTAYYQPPAACFQHYSEPQKNDHISNLSRAKYKLEFSAKLNLQQYVHSIKHYLLDQLMVIISGKSGSFILEKQIKLLDGHINGDVLLPQRSHPIVEHTIKRLIRMLTIFMF
jgi:hypothetical protein